MTIDRGLPRRSSVRTPEGIVWTEGSVVRRRSTQSPPDVPSHQHRLPFIVNKTHQRPNTTDTPRQQRRRSLQRPQHLPDIANHTGATSNNQSATPPPITITHRSSTGVIRKIRSREQIEEQAVGEGRLFLLSIADEMGRDMLVHQKTSSISLTAQEKKALKQDLCVVVTYLQTYPISDTNFLKCMKIFQSNEKFFIPNISKLSEKMLETLTPHFMLGCLKYLQDGSIDPTQVFLPPSVLKNIPQIYDPMTRQQKQQCLHKLASPTTDLIKKMTSSLKNILCSHD